MQQSAEKIRGRREKGRKKEKGRRLELVEPIEEKIEGTWEETRVRIAKNLKKFAEEGENRLKNSVNALGGTQADINEGKERLAPVQAEVKAAARLAASQLVKPEEIVAGRGYGRAEQLTEEETKAFEEAESERREQKETQAGRGYSGAEILTEEEFKESGSKLKEEKFDANFKSNLEFLNSARENFANLDRDKKKKNTPEWQAAKENYVQGMQKRRELLLGLRKSELEDLKNTGKEEWEKLGFGQEFSHEDMFLSKKELKAKYGKEYKKKINELEFKIAEWEKQGFNREFDFDKELDKQSQEIIKSTLLEEQIKMSDLKTELQLEGQGKSVFEKLKGKALKAVESYRKMPAWKKIALSGGLLAGGVGAGALGGAAGAAVLTGVVTGRWFQRSFGGAAAAVGLEVLIKKAQEKELQEKTLKLAEGLETAILNNDKSLDDKLFELEGTRKKQSYWRYGLAGSAGILIGSGLVGKAIHNVYEGVLHHLSAAPITMAEKMPTGMAKSIGEAKAENLSAIPQAESLPEVPKGEIFNPIETASRGDSVWKMTERQLVARYGTEFTSLPKGERLYIIDSLKDRVVAHPHEYGFGHGVRVGQKVDFSRLFENKEDLDKIFHKVDGLKVSQVRNIEHFHAHPRLSHGFPKIHGGLAPQPDIYAADTYPGVKVEPSLKAVPVESYRVPTSESHGTPPQTPSEPPPSGPPPVPPSGEVPPPPPRQPIPGPTSSAQLEQPTGHTLTAQEIADQKRKALELRQQQRFDQLRKQGKIPKKAPPGWPTTQTSQPPVAPPPPIIEQSAPPPPAPPTHIEESAAPEAVPHKVEATPEQRTTVKKVYKVLRGDESLETKSKKINKIVGSRTAKNVMRVYGKSEILKRRVEAEDKLFNAIFKKK